MPSVNVEIDSNFDRGFCLFAGLRDVQALAAKWKTWRDVDRALQRAVDPSSAMQRVLAEAAELRGRAMIEELECHPGYIRVVTSGLKIELYVPAERWLSIHVEFDSDSRAAARGIVQHIYDAYEGEVLSAGVAVAAIDDA